MTSRVLIAVAPNGARKMVQDHPQLPLTPLELAHTAAACADAGSGMIHLHVRDNKGYHTLEPSFYAPVLKELESAVGEQMLIQVTSESAGHYGREKQINLMRRLAPHCLSCGLREFIADDSQIDSGAKFYAELDREGVLVQHILYSTEDLLWYEKLCQEGILPAENHMLLFVFGRYNTNGGRGDQVHTLEDYRGLLRQKKSWMVCGFGAMEKRVAGEAVQCGGHVRVGFENNLYLPSGKLAKDNASLVEHTAREARLAGRTCGDRGFAESLFKGF